MHDACAGRKGRRIGLGSAPLGSLPQYDIEEGVGKSPAPIPGAGMGYHALGLVHDEDAPVRMDDRERDVLGLDGIGVLLGP